MYRLKFMHSSYIEVSGDDFASLAECCMHRFALGSASWRRTATARGRWQVSQCLVVTRERHQAAIWLLSCELFEN